MMKRERELIKNTLVIGFGTMLPKVAALVTLPIITGKLTKGEMGTYDLINTFISLFLPIATLQIQAAVFRFLIEYDADKEKKKKIISTSLCFVLVISLIAVIILFFVLYELEICTRFLICAYFIVDIFLIQLQQIARGLHKNRLYSVSAIVASFINMILVLLTVQVIHYGLNGVLLSITLATFMPCLILIYRLSIKKYFSISSFSLSSLKEMMAYSWPMIPNSLSNWVMNLSDRLVITGVLGIEANAVYSVANKIPNLFSSIQGTFVMAWQENASISSKDDDIADYYTKMFDSVFGILFAIMALLIAATPIIFIILIRGDYNDAYYQMPILFIALLFSAVASFVGGMYVACKQTKSIGITTIVAAAINFTLNIVFVRSIGIYAGSISTLISFLALSIFRMLNIKKYVAIRYNIKRIILMCLILVLLSTLCYQRVLAFDIINVFVAVLTSILFNKDIVRSIFKNMKL